MEKENNKNQKKLNINQLSRKTFDNNNNEEREPQDKDNEKSNGE